MTRNPALLFADLDLALMRLTGLRSMIDNPDLAHLPLKPLAAALNKAVDDVLSSYADLVVADEAVMVNIGNFLSTLPPRMVG